MNTCSSASATDINYFIISNNEKRFKIIVKIETQQFIVLKKDKNSDDYSKCVYENKYENIFVDKIILNESDTIYNIGGILFQINITDNTHIFIGYNIIKFKSNRPIQSFITILNDDNYSFPYSIDDENNIYLFSENVMIKPNSNTNNIIKKFNNPYDFYYDIDTLNSKYRELINYNVKYLYIQGNAYLFYYQMNPAKTYQTLTNNSQNQLYIIDRFNKKRKITKQEYIEINELWCSFFGLNNIIDYIKID
jgi:hypothetical protein